MPDEAVPDALKDRDIALTPPKCWHPMEGRRPAEQEGGERGRKQAAEHKCCEFQWIGGIVLRHVVHALLYKGGALLPTPAASSGTPDLVLRAVAPLYQPGRLVQSGCGVLEGGSLPQRTLTEPRKRPVARADSLRKGA